MSSRLLTTAAVAGFGLTIASARSSLAQPVLSVEGECPGALHALVVNSRPREALILLFDRREGSFTIPLFYPCAGIQLGLTVNFRQIAGTVSDDSGVAHFEGTAGPAACRGFLQTLNYPSGGCEVSNVVQIP